MSGRLIYEDRGTRISIMARVNAQRPDTLQQTGSRPTRKKSTCRPGAFVRTPYDAPRSTKLHQRPAGLVEASP